MTGILSEVTDWLKSICGITSVTSGYNFVVSLFWYIGYWLKFVRHWHGFAFMLDLRYSQQWLRITVFWDVTPSTMFGIYWHFEWTFVVQLHEPPPSGSEVWGNRSLWFVSKFVHNLFVMHIFQNQKVNLKCHFLLCEMEVI